jgi:hypothetical protein
MTVRRLLRSFSASRVRVSRRVFGLSRPLSLRQGICNLTVVFPESVAFRSFATLPVSGSGGASGHEIPGNFFVASRSTFIS